MLKRMKRKIQPIRANDGDYNRLLEFSRKAVPLIDSRFDKDFKERSTIRNSEPYDFEQRTIHYGFENLGYTITYRIGYEPKYGGHAEDRVILRVKGLKSGRSFEIECTRYYHNPRYIEIRLNLDEEQSQRVIDLFLSEFKQSEKMSIEEIRNALLSARSAVVHHAWSGAEMHARSVLKTEPMNPDALFYLGVSLAAQGNEEDGEEYLTRALKHDPTNYDIYYNLGLIHMKREEYDEAIALYIRGLYNSEDNHAIHYQLARAYEAAGKNKNAKEHYKKAIESSPNPDGAWYVAGKDYTEQAREALKRLS